MNRKLVKQGTVDTIKDAESDLQCLICTELFIKATTLNCSHSFCKSCIEQWRRKKELCPICRTKITTSTPTIALDNLVGKVTESSSSDVKEKRKEVIKSREQSKTKKSSTKTTQSDRVLRSSVTSLIESSSEEEDERSDDVNTTSIYMVPELYLDEFPACPCSGRPDPFEGLYR